MMNGMTQFEKMLVRAMKYPEYWQEDLRIKVADALNDEMKRQAVTKADLARRLGTSPAYITKILGGRQNLSLDSLAKVAFHLGLSWEPVLAPLNFEIKQLTDVRPARKVKKQSPPPAKTRTAKVA